VAVSTRATMRRWALGHSRLIPRRTFLARRGGVCRPAERSHQGGGALPLSGLGASPLHSSAALGYNHRWPAEVGGGWDEQPEVHDDLTLKLRSFKKEGRITPRRKPKGRGPRYTDRDHEKGIGGQGVGLLRSDAWLLQKSESFYHQGVAAAGEQRFAEARSLFEQSLEFHGNHDKTYLQWARMEQRLGNLQRSREIFEQGLSKNVGNPFLHQAFGVLEWECGDHDAARAQFQEALTAKPRDAVTFQTWGQLEAELGNTAAAEAVFKRGYACVPKRDCADLLFSWGKLEQGRSELQRVRRAVPHAASVCGRLVLFGSVGRTALLCASQEPRSCHPRTTH
jgi:tetratricopeptide (TPR) repeat protein